MIPKLKQLARFLCSLGGCILAQNGNFGVDFARDWERAKTRFTYSMKLALYGWLIFFGAPNVRRHPCSIFDCRHNPLGACYIVRRHSSLHWMDGGYLLSSYRSPHLERQCLRSPEPRSFGQKHLVSGLDLQASGLLYLHEYPTCQGQ